VSEFVKADGEYPEDGNSDETDHPTAVRTV
jgi:hypothetical protein